MAKERIKEIIAHHRNTQTHLWTAMLVTLSGNLTLLQFLNSILNKFLFGVGVLMSIFLFYVYLNKNEAIINLIKKLED